MAAQTRAKMFQTQTFLPKKANYSTHYDTCPAKVKSDHFMLRVFWVKELISVNLSKTLVIQWPVELNFSFDELIFPA